jgi:hypothetical protein
MDTIDITNLKNIIDEIVFEEINFFNEEESLELYDTCYHIMEEFIYNNPKAITEPDFEEEFDENIKELMDSHFDSDIYYTEEAENEMDEIIDKVKNDFFTYVIPPRSYPKSLILNEPNIDLLTQKIKYLRSKPQPEQRTKEWYQFRYNLITASNAWKAFESQAVINQLIYEKCQPLQNICNNNDNNNDNNNNNNNDNNDNNNDNNDNNNDNNNILPEEPTKLVNTNSTLHWGQKYEPLSVFVYEYAYNTKIGDFGCIQHDKYKFLGASPDGINIDPSSKRYGRMLEIKNIVNREIDGIPKKEYWIQIQLQMEVCDLNECDFLETKFIEYNSEEDFNEDTLNEISKTEDGEEFMDKFVSKDKKMKGLILYFHTKEGKPLYIYKPLDIVHHEDVNDWIGENVDLYESDKYKHVFMKIIYWKMEQISCVLVCRNKEWFKYSIQELQNIWSIIETERVNGYEHRAPNRKTKKDNSDININTNVSKCLLLNVIKKDTANSSITTLELNL